MSDPTPPTSYPPAWYPDPDSPKDIERYYHDGWTEHRRAKAQPPPQAAPPQSVVIDDGEAGTIVTLGYILAVIMPIVGFILGIVIATRPNKSTSKHGGWVILVSIVAFFIWAAIIASNSGTSTY